jgi:hypothetical protein
MSLLSVYPFSVQDRILVALLQAALTILPFLIAAALTAKLWRYIAAVRKFGTANLTPARANVLRRRHPALKAIQEITVLLGLVMGGLAIQAGYIAQGICNCAGITDYENSGGFLN